MPATKQVDRLIYLLTEVIAIRKTECLAREENLFWLLELSESERLGKNILTANARYMHLS